MVDRRSLEEALVAHPEYRALSDAPDSSVAPPLPQRARAPPPDEREVLKFGRAKGIGLEDPVFAAAAAAKDSLYALAAGDNASLSHYFDARLALLDHVPHANPRFAKLAFGRGAMWPLIEEAWTDLCEWTVYFVRRLQLARKPDLAFTFLMLNSGHVKETLHSETSPHDDNWATKLPVPKGAESPLDVLLPAHGDDAAAEALWERMNIFFFATRFTVFATFFKFSPHPPIFSPHPPIFSPLNYNPRAFFTPNRHKPFGSNPVRQGRHVPPRPIPSTRPHPAPPGPRPRPHPAPGSLPAWTASGAAQPPVSTSSTPRQ